MSALRSEWPGIHIVGEEDEDETGALDITTALRRDLCPAATCDLEVVLSDITVFVDPLDGTREFVEGRLDNVQSLVGFACRGRAMVASLAFRSLQPRPRTPTTPRKDSPHPLSCTAWRALGLALLAYALRLLSSLASRRERLGACA